MAVGPAALAAIPWGKVIEYAPQIADAARSLWKSVKSDTPSATEENATLATQVDRLTVDSKELHDQMLAASEIIARLADQNSQLSKRVRQLTYCAIFAVITSVIAVAVAIVY